MKKLISDMFEAALGLVFIAFVAVGLWLGGMSQGFEFDIVWGLAGGLTAFLVGLVLFGSMYVLLDIRDLLRLQVYDGEDSEEGNQEDV